LAVLKQREGKACQQHTRTPQSKLEPAPASVGNIRIPADFPPQQILLGLEPHFFQMNKPAEGRLQ
jgi:hypothetical protein